MRALAELTMRGRMQAILVVAGAVAIPLLFWLGAAAVGLVLLRRGLNDALGIAVWAMIPAIGWWVLGDPSALLVLVGTLVLAYLLRAEWSWLRILLCSIPLGLVYSVIISSAFAEPVAVMVDLIKQQLPELLEQMPQFSAADQSLIESLLAPVLIGVMAMSLQAFTLLALVLGRYWQALLFNPGGFGQEFQSLKLPVPVMVVLVLCMLAGPNLGFSMVALSLLCSMVLVFAGIAMIHGLVARKGLGVFWLVGMYALLLLFTQVGYPLLMVLAIVDSLFDFRGLRADKNGPDAPNGEG